jgi:hypothetical protein
MNGVTNEALDEDTREALSKGSPLTPSRSARSLLLRATAALLLLLSAYLAAGKIAIETPAHSPLNATASFLAVGDTGKVHRPLASLLEGQVAVGNDLASEDRVHPVDALVMLGDNFYMHGLIEEELVARIDQNLAYPYCHFVELGGARSSEVATYCSSASRRSSVLPIFALLGNHDLGSAGSPALQRDVIPQFISNWWLSTKLVVTREFAGGLSLILFNSESFARDAANRSALANALRTARGPWRVLAAHTPISLEEDASEPVPGGPRFEFRQWVEDAIEESGVRVHLYLSGHHHSLQLLEGGGELGPDLHVVVGSGARYRKILAPHPRRRYQAQRLGFARVDLVEGPGSGHEAGRLVVSLFKSPTIPLLRFGGAQLVARWSVGLGGSLQNEGTAP